MSQKDPNRGVRHSGNAASGSSERQTSNLKTVRLFVVTILFGCVTDP